VPSASPLSQELDGIKQLEDAGASAIVLYSLFEEQLRLERYELDHHMTQGTESFAEALTYFPQPSEFKVGPDGYLEHIRKAKETVQIPIIASLNGSTVSGWTNYARTIEEAGADALELNIYYIPTDMDQSSADVEQVYLDILGAVKSVVRIPVAIKIGPFFSNMANMAHRLDAAGADGLVLFNRFYQPDIDLESMEVRPNVLLSTPQALRLPMRWIAILYGHIRANMAATSGVHCAHDVLKMLMVGAQITQLASVLLRSGINQIHVIEQEMRNWMEEHEYESVQQMRGSMSQKNCADPKAFERAQYMRAIKSYVPA
jgi:dihydroorotate dehydrogenase (fumarate)